MIYAFIGDDLNKKKLAIDGLVADFNDLEYIVINSFNFNNEEFLNFIAGSDIFSKKYLILLDSILESNFNEVVLDKIETMNSSENVFILKETTLFKKPTDILKKYSKVFKDFSLIKENSKKFNIFSLTDSFGERNKKNTWVLMQKALRENVKAEDILNILIWQAKNLLLVQNAKDVKSSGLNPFVYRKTKDYAKNFKETELKNISRDLTILFHESHLGLELEPNLEIFILKTL
jgi:hypothetical protein